jgi:hypothetical protein
MVDLNLISSSSMFPSGFLTKLGIYFKSCKKHVNISLI